MKQLLILLLFVPALVFAQQIKPISGVPHEIREAGNVTFVEQLHYHGAERIFSVGGVTVIYRGEASYADVVNSGVVGSSYCAEFQAVYDKWTTKPHDDTAAIFNTMVETLVDGGVWDSLDIFPFFAIHTNDDGEALIDWIHPDSTLTAVNSPTFTPYEGFTGDGSTSYINTNYNPNADGENYTLNDASLGFYSRTDKTETSVEMGVEESTQPRSYMLIRYQSNDQQLQINCTSSGYQNQGTNSTGLFMGLRFTSDSLALYRNNLFVFDLSTESSSLPDLNFAILGCNDDGVVDYFSTRQVSMVFIGSSLSETKRTILFNAIETAMDALGKGVIP